MPFNIVCEKIRNISICIVCTYNFVYLMANNQYNMHNAHNEMIEKKTMFFFWNHGTHICTLVYGYVYLKL